MKKAPSLCETCQNARNCINGRYCLALRRYVHHVTAQTCDSFKQETEQIKTKENEMSKNVCETYFLDVTFGSVYFNVVDGSVQCRGLDTKVSPDKLNEFLAIAKELGLRTGKI